VEIMSQANISMQVRRLSHRASVIDIVGDVTGSAEATLMDAYAKASAAGASTIILNFSQLDYMNSSGIGLLVTLLVRAQRQKQKLMAYGLSDHYRQIFDLTRLNEAISIHDNEASALAAS
jgi:anti-sigma B factor antagonist